MGSVHKHSSGRSPFYFAKFRGPDGSVCVKSTKQRIWQKAVEICNKWERAAQQAASGSLTEVQARKVIGEIFETGAGEPLQITTATEWMSQWLKMKEATKAIGTYKRYKLLVERFLKTLGKKALGNLASVTLLDVQRFRDAELNSGVSSASADLAVKTLRIPFNLARRQGIITVNPAEGVELLRESGETRNQFSEQQVRQIIAVAEGEWKGVIRVGFYTGGRLGNCVGLRWTEIDWEKSVVAYQQKKHMRGKKQKAVVCPVHPVLLRDLMLRRHSQSEGDFVFPSLSQKSISGKTGLSSQFEGIITKAGIEIPLGEKRTGRGRRFHKLGFHSLKHSFISALANKQVPPEVRKLLVGHKSDRVHDIYSHLDLPTLASAIKQLPEI